MKTFAGLGTSSDKYERPNFLRFTILREPSAKIDVSFITEIELPLMVTSSVLLNILGLGITLSKKEFQAFSGIFRS
jgi:hypothetical protein